MSSIRRVVAVFVVSAAFLGLSLASAVAQPKPGHLDEVLRQMDAASLKFQSAEADFQWDLYEKVVRQTTTQKGTIYFKKEGGTTGMGVKMTSPSLKFIEFRNGVLRLFEPGTDHLTMIDATKNKAMLESFLTVGFGGSGKELAKAWNISDLGDETVDGVQTVKLDLVPKDPAVR